MNNLIKSPINYTGNKYRILEQISKHFPKKIKCMIDVFCGGATVGLNVDAEKIIFVDNNEKIINLLSFLALQDFDYFLYKCEEVIEKFNLSYSAKNGYKIYREKCSNLKDNNGLKDYNSEGFYKMRTEYNSLKDKTSDEANILLYMLMVYGFNNDIRFNSEGNYNLPIGKTDLNKLNIEKIKNYILRTKKINYKFVCASFNSDEFKQLLVDADFVYMDPPYLISNAVYNTSWNSQMEYSLLDFIDSLILNRVNFALSNVIQKVGKTNEPLAYWCHKNRDLITVNNIDYHYRSASYNKTSRNAKEQEVLIINKEYNNED